MNKQELGRFGENQAAEYLRREGYRILDRNYRCGLGEIDIVARKGDSLRFVEVKTRTGFYYGSPAEAVDKNKQTHIRRVAEIYMRSRRIHPLGVSFDVMEVCFNHIKDAF